MARKTRQELHCRNSEERVLMSLKNLMTLKWSFNLLKKWKKSSQKINYRAKLDHLQESLQSIADQWSPFTSSMTKLYAVQKCCLSQIPGKHNINNLGINRTNKATQLRLSLKRGMAKTPSGEVASNFGRKRLYQTTKL